jgi:hypothetical protein
MSEAFWGFVKRNWRADVRTDLQALHVLMLHSLARMMLTLILSQALMPIASYLVSQQCRSSRFAFLTMAITV